MTRKYHKSVSAILPASLLGIIMLVVAGCATVPPPTALMDQATAAVQAAERAGGSMHAPLELEAAHDKLALAQAAMGRGDYAEAGNLANESVANSNLARIKSELAVQREANQELGAENARMRSNMLQSDPRQAEHQGGAA